MTAIEARLCLRAAWQRGGLCHFLKSWDLNPLVLSPAKAAFPSTSPKLSSSLGLWHRQGALVGAQCPGASRAMLLAAKATLWADSGGLFSALTGSGTQGGQLSVQPAALRGRSPLSCRRWMAGRFSEAAHGNASTKEVPFPQPYK